MSDSFPEGAALIIGAGHFGRRAVRILREKSNQKIVIVDKDEKKLAQTGGPFVERVMCDGIEFLVDNFHFLSASNTIIPAVPVHLAFEWLRRCPDLDSRITQVQAPEVLKSFLPHTWTSAEGSLLISYADFLCPDDCPEPAGQCTVTGEKRSTPLYDLLQQLDLVGYEVHVIRSRQLAPGLGGFKVDDLSKLLNRIKKEKTSFWLLGTACRCHGTLTAVQVHP